MKVTHDESHIRAAAQALMNSNIILQGFLTQLRMEKQTAERVAKAFKENTIAITRLGYREVRNEL